MAALASFQEKWQKELRDAKMAMERKDHEMAVELHNQAYGGGGDNPHPVTKRFRVQEDGGRGDCLFHVFRALKGMPKNQAQVMKVRTDVCRYMRTHRGDMATLCDAHGDGVINETVEEYITKESGRTFVDYVRRMSRQGEYGGEIEIMCASMLYKVRISVWKRAPGDPADQYTREYQTPDVGGHADVWDIYWLDVKLGGHYQRLLPPAPKRGAPPNGPDGTPASKKKGGAPPAPTPAGAPPLGRPPAEKEGGARRSKRGRKPSAKQRELEALARRPAPVPIPGMPKAADRAACDTAARKIGVVLTPFDVATQKFNAHEVQAMNKVLRVLLLEHPKLVVAELEVLHPLADYLDPKSAYYKLPCSQKYKSEASAALAYTLDYSLRRLEINDMTLGLKKCECCSRNEVVQGVFGAKSNDTFRSTHGVKNWVYRNPKDAKCLWIAARDWEKSGKKIKGKFTERLDTVCSHCIKSLAPLKHSPPMQPEFSPAGGFGHGVPVPECLLDLSFAERALISRIQAVMMATTLSTGMRAVKGMCLFVDRTSTLQDIENIFPRLPSEVDIVMLLRKMKAGHKVKWRELRCRRAKVKAALDWLQASVGASAD